MITIDLRATNIDPDNIVISNDFFATFDKIDHIVPNGNDLVIVFKEAVDVSYENSIIAWLDTYIPDLVASQKQEKYSSIDNMTLNRILEGFDFDNIHFSMSDKAQINWNNIKTAESLLTWPVEISCDCEDSFIYSLQKVDLDSFIGASLVHKWGLLDSGRALKQSVLNSTTQADLDAVVDNR